MEFDLTISNYRCFPADAPATLRVRPGFTAFVGLNNSGKSAILRSLFEMRSVFALASSHGGLINLARGHFNWQKPEDVGDSEEIFSNLNRDSLSFSITFPTPSPHPKVPTRRRLRKLTLVVDRREPYAVTGAFELEDGTQLDAPGIDVQPDGRLLVRSNDATNAMEAMKACATLASTIYVPAFRNAVNAGGGGKHFDLFVGGHIAQRWESMRGSLKKGENAATEEVVTQLTRVFGLSGLSIQKIHGHDRLQLYVDGRAFRLDEVGAGISQFALVLINVAFSRPALLLIDEPELNLHPSLQTEFLTTLAGYTTYGVLFATHSLGLARLNARSIFSVVQRIPGRSTVHELHDTPDLPSLYRAMAYDGLENPKSLLLVEGVTDLAVFRHFLSLYGKGDHIIPFPLRGREGMEPKHKHQLSELARVCPKVSAIIDSERPVPAGAKDFFLVFEKNGTTTSWGRIWNYAPEADYTYFVQGREGTPIGNDPLCEVGCPYVLRGFDFDYIGLLWMSDLVWRKDRWVPQLHHVHESAWKKTIAAARTADPSSPGTQNLSKRLRRGYRILLTRAIKGLYVWCEDQETRDHIQRLLRAPL